VGSGQARNKLQLCEKLRDAGVVGIEMVCGQPTQQQPSETEGTTYKYET
jgi:hypothetical protein